MMRPSRKKRALWLAVAACVLIAAATALFLTRMAPNRLTLPDGDKVPRNPALHGKVETAKAQGAAITISGWAVDLGTMLPANAVVFVDGERLRPAAPTIERPDVVKSYVTKTLSRSGFEVTFQSPYLRLDPDSAVRVFAVGESGWNELEYGAEFPFAREPDPAVQISALRRDLNETRRNLAELTEQLRTVPQLAAIITTRNVPAPNQTEPSTSTRASPSASTAEPAPKISEALPAAAAQRPHASATRVEYSSYGHTGAVIPTQNGRARPGDGASILGPSFAPSRDDAKINIRVVVGGFLTKGNEFVVAVFRDGDNQPVGLGVRRAAAGNHTIVDETFTITAGTVGRISFDVRVGLGKTGGAVYINGDTKGQNRDLPPPYVEIWQNGD